MNRKTDEMIDRLLEILGPETLLEDLLVALSTDQVEEHLIFIARMRDIDLD